MMPRPPRRETLQRGIIILPSAFTLGNLFFGLYAIVSASRGEFLSAGWFIILAGVLDMLDGSVARFTRTGSRFGAELDSLVDAISFGVARPSSSTASFSPTPSGAGCCRSST